MSGIENRGVRNGKIFVSFRIFVSIRFDAKLFCFDFVSFRFELISIEQIFDSFRFEILAISFRFAFERKRNSVTTRYGRLRI